MNKMILAVAVAGALASPSVESPWAGTWGPGGRRAPTRKQLGVAAYKAQRRANRLRRKALNK